VSVGRGGSPVRGADSLLAGERFGAREIRLLARALPFPDPRAADESGLLAYGGDLGPARLLSAYASGVFPWYESGPILWFSPDPRLVLLPSEVRVRRSLRKTLRQGRFEVRLDTAFDRVIRACAAARRPGQSGTWINADMIEAYTRLHALGFAHAVETWREGELVGGLYGVSLGAAFFGESMFSLESDASKVALVELARRLERRRFHFIDCQLPTEHLEGLGAVRWRRARFLDALDRALEEPTRRGRWTDLREVD
jgi:leucyl/phenylalanyl-tRNA--protein transferase